VSQQSSPGTSVLGETPSSSQQRSAQSGLSALAVAEVPSQQPSEQPALETLALAGVSSQQASEQPASGFVTLGGVLPLPQQASAQLKVTSRVSCSREILRALAAEVSGSSQHPSLQTRSWSCEATLSSLERVTGTSLSTLRAVQRLSRRQSLAAIRRRHSSTQNQPSNTHSSGVCRIPTTTSTASCRSPISSAVTGHGSLMCQLNSGQMIR
jgi:hypothetical protein